MFDAINNKYRQAKNDLEEEAFMIESVLDADEEILPGSDAEDDEIVDGESIPAEVMAQVDKALDAIINKPGFDDTEIEELVEEDEDLEEAMDEACAVIGG